MKSVHKIILGNSLAIVLMVLVYAFSYQKFDLILTKLRFVEIADNLHASFLEMRLSEKNYFLYGDSSALPQIKKQLQGADLTINSVREKIIRATGEKNFNELRSSLRRYEQQIEKIGESSRNTVDMEISVREAGRQLRLFSEGMINLERKRVNEIILASRRQLSYFFGLAIFLAVVSSYSFFSRMFRSIRRIEKTANSISKGDFVKIQGKIPKNELGSAMEAINSMCEELQTRHEQLIQSRKLASLGVLTAGVAHELGNPLNNISMVAQTYLELYQHLSEEDRVDYIKTVLEETERIRKIVQSLLDFSKPKEADFAIADINNVVRNSIKILKNTLDVSGIDTKLELEEKLPPVFIVEDKIQEVFVNLITNSIQAASAGDTMFVRTKLGKDQDYAIVEIEDTGRGIPPEILAHIFDPFFSTKGTEGTGLGLSISYGIIKKHKGKIDVKSEVGVGTTFTIQLPIHMAKEGKDERAQNHGDR